MTRSSGTDAPPFRRGFRFGKDPAGTGKETGPGMRGIREDETADERRFFGKSFDCWQQIVIFAESIIKSRPE